MNNFHIKTLFSKRLSKEILLILLINFLSFSAVFQPKAQDTSPDESIFKNAVILKVNQVNSGTYNLALSKVSQMLVDKSAARSLQEVINAKGFENTREGRVRSFSADEVVWYRFILGNTSDNDINLILKTNHRTVIDATLYQLDSPLVTRLVESVNGHEIAVDLTRHSQTFGHYQSFEDRVIRSKKYSVPLLLPGNSEQHFYLRWVNEGQAAYSMQVVDVSSFFSQQMFEQAFVFITLGFSLAVLIYCAVIYWKTKEKLYVSYGLYILVFLLFIEVHSGSVARFWPDFIPHEMQGRFLWTSAFLTMLAFSRFTAHFLLLSERFPDINTGINYFQGFCILFALASLLLPYQVVEMSVYLMTAIIIPFALFASVLTIRKFNDSGAKIYLLSFSPISIYILFLVSVYALELYEFPYMLEGIRAAFGLNLLFLSATLVNQISIMAEKQQIYESKLIAASASESAKNDFFGKMSHEIRTPLTGVLGVSQLLQDTELTEQQQKYVDILRSSSRALMHFVDNALDYSRVEAGKMPLQKVSFDLENLLLDIERVFVLKTFESQVPLLFEVQETIPRFLRGDVNRIRQILINLVANAYKFTSNGHIIIKIFQDITAEKSKEKGLDGVVWFKFEVVDTGIGIPAAQIESIFEDFTQVYTTNSRRYGGAGLGLAICRELSKLLDGEIGLESEIGKGSRFWLRIPIERVEMNEAPIENLSSKRFFDFRLKQNEFLVSKTFLLIDSCEAYREHMQHVARAWGMKAGVAASLPEGLAKIRTANEVDVEIDLIMLDYQCLQNDDGSNHFLAALERHKASKNSAIVVLTAQVSIAARFNVLRSASLFIAQRPAFVYKLEDVFIAALKRDEGFFEHNRPLFDMQLNKEFDQAVNKDI